MISIYWKEINAFFSSLIAYIAIGVFLVVMGVMLWFLPDFSLLEYNYATLAPFFDLAPVVFAFLIPAITMRSFSEERQTGTIELLATRPVTDLQIILGKFFASLTLVLFALIPTIIYYITVYQLGVPKGNLDSGAILGSYFGLFLLAGAFASIGVFASSLSANQIVAFLLAILLCVFFHWGFFFFSKLPVFVGTLDDFIQQLGIDYHYDSISRGVLDTRSLLYFFSAIAFFIALTLVSLERRKW
ncbi:MAG: gliding motility-associated ABC transporter permease subunit GldF [Saprospirales bacterium]|nr:gliding motility-associated ABC transporter permease subunit GldF [Saprospirales bacterium]MBK6905237.1 gliding motility-associated ABC transporter permease subunit GldF [Saprospirales bacterium]MBK7335097.1 gliding motility-associated ABC transporter permease subunit GldF [Saprospirales bacterium]